MNSFESLDVIDRRVSFEIQALEDTISVLKESVKNVKLTKEESSQNWGLINSPFDFISNHAEKKQLDTGLNDLLFNLNQ